MGMTCTLYRHFAADGSLLYVGISSSALIRLHKHKQQSDWFPDIATITMEHLGSVEVAKAAEKVAIQTEQPRYNKHWWVNPAPPPKPRSHPCKECGASVSLKRTYCTPCAKEKLAGQITDWRHRNVEKCREYGRKHRHKARSWETGEERRLRLVRDGLMEPGAT